ncbi:DUF3798 domain-containing protein [Peptostreptococcus equinus]|uniref:DUF3798 domain-containing protein n=1 Tax=Peptostreptococcus equinus TaxID=3003601 RepID=A0ABY7JQF5_9FIRM|nr:DUF3798 domain-containing protein [Peptostreptococcus sp. CBA3647]WAW15580.1 DUF3798 domain-containing protein [Peptostreptococcus sp. CBA3647]
MCFTNTACSKFSNKDNKNTQISKKAKYTVYMPKDSILDNRIIKDKEVAINYLEKKDKYGNDDVDKIVNNVDKNVRVLIISSNSPGLLKAFEKIKEKIPGLVTVAIDLPELDNNKNLSSKKNKSVEISLSSQENTGGLNAAKFAKSMGAKEFLYLSLNNSPRPFEYEDIEEVENFCKLNGMKFTNAKIESNAMNGKINENINNIFSKGKELAVFPASPELSELVFDNAIRYKYIVPNLNSNNDGLLLSKKFNLEKSYELNNSKSYSNDLQKKIESMGLKDRLGLIPEGKSNILIGLVIKSHQYMYKNRFELEESFSNINLSNRLQEEYGYMSKIYKINPSITINKTIKILPRIY